MTESDLRLEKFLKSEFADLTESLCRDVRDELRVGLALLGHSQKAVAPEVARSGARCATSPAQARVSNVSSKARHPTLTDLPPLEAALDRPQRPFFVRSYKAHEFANGMGIDDDIARFKSVRSKGSRFAGTGSTTRSVKSVDVRNRDREDSIEMIGVQYGTTVLNKRPPCANSYDDLRLAAHTSSGEICGSTTSDKMCLPGALEVVAKSSGQSCTGSQSRLSGGYHPNQSLVLDDEDLAGGRMFASREVGKFDQQVEKAMGLTPHSMYLDEELVGSVHYKLHKLVQHKRYAYVVLIAIFFNGIVIGAQSDWLAKNVRDELPVVWRVFEIMFGIGFTIEVSLRIFVYGYDFWQGYGWAWHLMDVLLVLTYISQEIVRILCSTAAIDETSFLRRSLVVARSIQIVRLLHLVRASDDLRLLLSCLMHSLRTFFWAMALLWVMTYIMGIILTDVTADARGALDIDVEGRLKLTDGFGSVPRTLLSLFQSISGGVDWDGLARPLIESVSTIWGLWFGVYIAIIVFALLNVVTGLFVQTALKQAEFVLEKQKMAEAWKIFQDIDKGSSGYITKDEMLKQLDSAHVQEYFKSIDLDPAELNTLFNIIDTDHSGSVDFEEFLNGCLRFQGTAKSTDVLLIMQEMRLSFRALQNLLQPWYEEYCGRTMSLTPTTPKPYESQASTPGPRAEPLVIPVRSSLARG